MENNEDYVSFETAKLLHSWGFWSDECVALYDCGNNNKFVRDDAIFQNGAEDYLEYEYNGEEWRRFGYYLAPTLQMAMKWLRKEKGIAIIPVLSSILDNEKFLWDVKIVVANTGDTYSQGWVYEEQEEACETAIKYLKNLI